MLGSPRWCCWWTTSTQACTAAPSLVPAPAWHTSKVPSFQQCLRYQPKKAEQYAHKLTQGLCWAGEVLVSPKMVLLMDEISTGLDSSTTYQICSCLRNLAHLRRCTILVSLLQPAPETFALFDDLLLLSEGAGCCCESADVLLRLPVRPSQPAMLTCGVRMHGVVPCQPVWLTDHGGRWWSSSRPRASSRCATQGPPASCVGRLLGSGCESEGAWCTHAGHMVYMGPREGIIPFFATLGFAPPPRKGAADFLQEVTSLSDQVPLAGWLAGRASWPRHVTRRWLDILLPGHFSLRGLHLLGSVQSLHSS